MISSAIAHASSFYNIFYPSRFTVKSFTMKSIVSICFPLFLIEWVSNNIELQKDKAKREYPNYRFFNISLPDGIRRHIGNRWGWYSETAAIILDDPVQLAQFGYKLKLS